MAVGSPPRDVPIEDLGQAAIVPGLVNAHTHLEFSDLAAPIGRPGMGLVDWLGSVISIVPTRRRGPFGRGNGLRESVGHGVTTIGEIAQPGGIGCLWRLALRRHDLPGIDCPAGRSMEAALAAAGKHVLENGRWQAGLSPHAPVHGSSRTACPGRGAFRSSTGCRWPCTWPNRARSWNSCATAADRFASCWNRAAPGNRPPGRSAHGRWTNFACSSVPMRVVVHGNYLDDEEIDFLGRQRRQMAVVYCPRTHAWFGHARYPLEKLLAAGAIVALGTDSRASSPDLSLLAEMRHVAREFPAMCRATILELGTLGGARALGFDSRIGTLEPGKRANLAAVALPEDAAADPHELLLDAAGAVVATWVRGNRV